MKLPKSSERVEQIFDKIVSGMDGIQLRKTFGYPSAYVNGNMFAGVHGEQIVMKVTDAVREELLASGKAKIFSPMPGRTMKQYAAFSGGLLDNTKLLKDSVEQALKYTSSLPKKSKAK